MARMLFRQMVVNVFQRIGGARVLRDFVVVQIDVARNRIVSYVFQNRPKTMSDAVDLWLSLLGKADYFGVATILKIEDAVVAPAMLIVANQVAVGVGGKRGLAGAGESKEDGHVAVIAHIGGAVHGQHAFQRQQEVQHGEDGLLDFAGVI